MPACRVLVSRIWAAQSGQCYSLHTCSGCPPGQAPHAWHGKWSTIRKSSQVVKQLLTLSAPSLATLHRRLTLWNLIKPAHSYLSASRVAIEFTLLSLDLWQSLLTLGSCSGSHLDTWDATDQTPSLTRILLPKLLPVSSIASFFNFPLHWFP